MNILLQDLDVHSIVTNQGTHFINDVIRYLTEQFILRHTSSTIYCP
jgi:hypothetical protein